jgi:hypothetical protein
MSASQNNDRRTVRPAALAAALVLMALLLVLVVIRQQPPAPVGLDAPPEQFSAERAAVLLQEMQADGVPHSVGSEASERVQARIVAALGAAGYEAEVYETVACRGKSGAYAVCAPVQNIVARLDGLEDGPALMLMAHHDSVRAGPGAADDSSSVAEIIEIARALREQGPYRNPIIFHLNDAEELGLLGAKGFVDDHPWAEDVAVVINMEARGTRGLSYMFETSTDNAWLIDAYASSVRRPASSSLHYEVYRILPNDTDLTVTREAGMAGFNFAFIDRGSHYHTPLDRFENLDQRSVQHQGENVLALAQELAETDLSAPPAGDAAWTDVLGFFVVHWPASWTMPLAILGLSLLLVVSVVVIRRTQLGVGGLLLGLLAAFLTLVLTILAGLGLTWLISQVVGEPSPWTAYPQATRVAVWTSSLLCAGLVSGALARRAGAWGLALGTWLLWALLALVLSFVLPGLSILFLLPGFVAAVLFASLAFTPLVRSGAAREAACIVPALVGGALWLPLAFGFESAVGFDLSPAITLAVGLSATGLVPFFALPRGRRLGGGVVITAAIVVVVAAIVAMLLPPYSASDPQQVNLYHFEDRDAGTAHWVGFAKLGTMPESLDSLFDPEVMEVFPWLPGLYMVAEAPLTEAPAPDLELLSDTMEAGQRVVEVQLRSPRGAEGISLHVPMGALAEGDPSAVTAAGYRFDLVAEDAVGGYYSLEWGGYYTLDCFGRGCDGLVVELRLQGEAPVEVLVVDSTSGLPAGGDVWLQARPDTAVPVNEGDLTLLMKRVDL